MAALYGHLPKNNIMNARKYINNMVAAMLVGIAATCLFSACSKDDDHESTRGGDEKPVPEFAVADSRTVMVYIAADNNISSNAYSDLDEIVKGFVKYSYGKNNRVVAFVDRLHSAPCIYVLNDTTTAKSYRDLVPVKTYASDVNSASADVLGDFVDYVQANYPAQSYGLVLGSHGFGWIPPYVQTSPSRRTSRSFATDDTSGYGLLGMGTDEIAEVLAGKGVMDFIFFDACFMQTIEVDCDLMDVAKHIVASPAEVPSPGADYAAVVPEMFRKDGYAEGICRAYNNTYLYDEEGGVVLSDVNTDSLRHAIPYMRSVFGGYGNFDNYAEACEYVTVSNLFSYHKYLTVASFYPDMPDMRAVMSELMGVDGIGRWNTEMAKVVKCWHGKDWYCTGVSKEVGNVVVNPLVDEEHCSGISMFVPRAVYDSNGAYFNDYYKQTRFVKLMFGND